MRYTDIFIELIRLAEQAGSVIKAGMKDDGNCWVDVRGRDGKVYTFSVHKEEK